MDKMSHYYTNPTERKNLSIDNIIQNANQDRDIILDTLSNNPELLRDYLYSTSMFISNENNCDFNLCKKNKYSYYICYPCLCLKTITGTCDVLSTEIVVTDKRSIITKLKLRTFPIITKKIIIEDNNFYSDDFINNMLISWIVSNKFSSSNIIAYKPVLNFICNDVGYQLGYSYKLITNTNDYIYNILIQLTIMFKILNGVDYNQGSHTLNDIGLSDDSFFYMIGRKKIKQCETIIITNYTNSSLTYNNIKILNINNLPYENIVNTNENSNMGYNDPNKNIGPEFIIFNETELNHYYNYGRFQTRQLNSGFDLYCFIINLMFDKTVRNIILNKYQLYWKNMWIDNHDKLQVESKLDSGDLYKILSMVKLKTNVLTPLYNILHRL